MRLITPKKIWAFGDLYVDSGQPYGTVYWRYHAAPLIDIVNPDGSTGLWDLP